MARLHGHVLAGAATGCAVALWDRRSQQKQVEFSHLLIGLLVGVSCALLADVLEPATNPSHRGFFHSVGFAALLGIQSWTTLKEMDKTETDTPLLLKVAAAGYASHLVLDSMTPRGLPII